LTTLSYLEIAKYLQSAGKKIYFILEGGYNEDVITEVSDAIIRLF
jgi:acetoin utilization deacetylase AcuC-like enzyme